MTLIGANLHGSLGKAPHSRGKPGVLHFAFSPSVSKKPPRAHRSPLSSPTTMDKLMEYKANIEKRLERYEKLNELEKSTGVDKFYIFAAGAVVTGILLFVIGGAELILNLIGFIYPAYASFKALSSPGTEDDTQWLTYWVVYTFYKLTEEITDLVLCWIPFYYFIKVGFLVWCYHPSTVGASVIYGMIKPHIAPYVQKVDTAVSEATKKTE